LEADAMETLTRNLLATARAASHAEDVLDVVAAGDLVRAVVSRIGILAARRGVELRTSIAVEATIAGRFDELEQALLTVVHNGLKHARTNGCVTVGVRLERGAVEIRVTDDGAGFSPAALQRALDRFWRESGTASDVGHGLGLPIANAIVTRFGGNIALTNASHGGASVAFTFPRSRAVEVDELRRGARAN
jgi:signal transduction histidine kinase